MANLGSLLSTARERCNLTLRAVEAQTGISNAYLSQLEKSKIKAPSPIVLHKLSELYGISYAMVLEQAGYPVPAERKAHADRHKLAARIGPTTEEEADSLVEYLQFLRSRRKRGGTR
jgi:transcriptional regulator with XRE-family HTH domain